VSDHELLRLALKKRTVMVSCDMVRPVLAERDDALAENARLHAVLLDYYATYGAVSDGHGVRELEAARAQLAALSAPVHSDRITTTGDNEITSYPWWGVVDPKRGCDGVIGPFFSRKTAEEHLALKRHRYGPKARVFCFSGHDSADYRAVHRHVKDPATDDSNANRG